MTSVKAGVKGSMMSQLVKKIKSSLQTIGNDFADAIYANKKKSIAFVIVGLLVVTGLTFFMLTMNTQIRAAQIDNLIYEELPTKKMVPFSYDQGDAIIHEKKAISVMFAKPNQPDTNQAMKIIKDKDKELNRNFYYYPLVYQTSEVTNTYDLAPDEVTFIFFQNGKEKNRFVLSSIDNPEENFIPELNRLPMWNIKAQEN